MGRQAWAGGGCEQRSAAPALSAAAGRTTAGANRLMNITRAQSSDAALLAALHAQCFAEHWSASAFAEMTDSPNVVGLLMRTNSEASSGFIILRLAADECEILSLGIV